MWNRWVLVLLSFLSIVAVGCGSPLAPGATPPLETPSAEPDPSSNADPLRPIVAVAAGSEHTCVLREDGFVWCFGRLVPGIWDAADAEPRVVAGLGDSPVAQLTGGGGFACTRHEDGSVRCFGRRDLGQHGDGELPATGAAGPTLVSGLDDAVDLDAGGLAACAVRAGGAVVCWGELGMSGLVEAASQVAPAPLAIDGLVEVVAVRLGTRHACALHRDTTVSCWGLLPQASSPYDAPTPVWSAPARVADLDRVVALDVLARRACAVRDDATLWCWGVHERVEYTHDIHDDGSRTNFVDRYDEAVARPRQWPSAGAVLGFVAADTASCVWTREASGEELVVCGSDDPDATSPVARFPLPDGARAITVGATVWDGHACVVDAAGELRCAGSNRNGQLGLGPLSLATPHTLAALGPLDALAAGRGRTCGLRQGDGAVLCLGSNEVGALGDGTEQWRHTPGEVTGLAGVRAVFAGALHGCALLDEARSSLSCWGYGFYGQLGTDLQGASSPVPLPVGGLPAGEAIADVALAAETSCVLLEDASVWCWGKTPGTRGYEAGERDARPRRVSEPGSVRRLAAAGADTVCALGMDGGVRCGLGASGSPREVEGLDGATRLALGGAHGCAIVAAANDDDDDGGGAVRCWGDNSHGQLGRAGEGGERAAPVEGLEARAVEVVAGNAFTCARLAGDDGGVWCWGDDRHGQLGQGTISRGGALPREVPGVPSGTLVAGAEHACVLARETGLATCWGSNWSGELGVERAWVGEHR